MRSPEDFPSCAGTYLVGLELATAREVVVGSLGLVVFHPGLYLYVGSARGPGGLAARLRRHLHGGERKHWHLDYLRTIAEPMLAWTVREESRLECRWAETLSSMRGVSPGPGGFGASDCRCRTHLFRATISHSELGQALEFVLPAACRQAPGASSVSRKLVT